MEEGQKLKSAQKEAEAQLQTSRAILEPLEQELAAKVSMTDENLQARPLREVEQLGHKRLRILEEGLSRLAGAE